MVFKFKGNKIGSKQRCAWSIDLEASKLRLDGGPYVLEDRVQKRLISLNDLSVVH